MPLYQRYPNQAKDWHEWVSYFLAGRTHVAYGLIAATVSSGVGVVISANLGIRALFVITLIGSLGGLVDTVAHLYYH